MKKILLLLVAIIGIAFFTSCEKEPQEEPQEEPFPIGTWRATYRHFSLTVNNVQPETLTERIKQEFEHEQITAFSEEEAYRLTFNEDGTGLGSGMHPVGNGLYTFIFKWNLSNGYLSFNGERFFL